MFTHLPDTTLSVDMGLKPSQLLVPLGTHPAAALGPDNGNKHRKKKTRGVWRAERQAGRGAGALQLNVHSGDDPPPC